MEQSLYEQQLAELDQYLEIRNEMMLALATARDLRSVDEETGDMIIDLDMLQGEEDWPELATMIRDATPIPDEYIHLLRGENPDCYLDF